MKIKILNIGLNTLVNAIIRIGNQQEMPSIQEGWRFNFDKHIKLKNATAYILITEEIPGQIEGCMIFQLKNKEIPYMAYVEVAPHNKGIYKKYDNIAGCLIAFAFRLSIIQGVGDYKGMLTFDVQEQTERDQVKLMKLYSNKFNAQRIDDTTMVIIDADGEALIEKYLKYID